MKIYAISVFKKTGKTAVELSAARELASFGYFQRSSVNEFITLFCKTLAERTAPNVRQSVAEQDYVMHVQCRSDDLAVVVCTDKEYPDRVAFGLISKVVEEFMSRYPPSAWTSNPADMPFPRLQELCAKYQNPSDADPMTKVQKDLDDTKDILRVSMEKVLDRGEKIDDLVARSDQLSASSKMFYTTAKKTNSCCTIS